LGEEEKQLFLSGNQIIKPLSAVNVVAITAAFCQSIVINKSIRKKDTLPSNQCLKDALTN
jgi:hypothetical protein